MSRPEDAETTEARKEAREEAERRWPEKYDTTAYTGENEQRAKRAGFVAGAAWQASRAPQPTEAEWSCEQGCKAPSAVCLLDHRPAPQSPEDDREALALAISEARSSRMTTEFDRGIADVVFDWMREQGFCRAPVEPAVRGEWEYGIRSEYDEIPLSELWPTFDVAQARVSNIRGGRWVIIRRRKAGPWEPVPRGADDE